MKGLTVGQFREWLLSYETTTEVLSKLAPGLTPEMAQTARTTGRRYREMHVQEGETWLVFEAGQPCFRASTHRKSLEREPIVARLYLAADGPEVRGGVWLKEQLFWSGGEPARVGWAQIDDWEHTFNRRWIRRPDKMLTDPFGQRNVRAHMHPGHESLDAVGLQRARCDAPSKAHDRSL